ncbi:MAG: hypothetical protein HOK71_15170 [Planctomycetaceae bacterium]|nr:hypothetical protein [Planctomycetaceae bacterium]
MVNLKSRTSIAVMLQLALIGCGPEGPSGHSDDPLQLHLAANDDGSLKQMTFNEQTLGNNDGSFEKLATEIKQFVWKNGKAEGSDLQIDISADQRLRFEFVHRAASLSAGRFDEKTASWSKRINDVRLINPAASQSTAVPHSFSIDVPFLPEPDYGMVGVPDVKVRLTANDDGSLEMLTIGRRRLGNDNQAIDGLNHEILKIIGEPGNPLVADIEVEIDADGVLRYQHVVEAIKACNGRLGNNGWVTYIEKIKFAGIGSSRGQDEFLHEIDLSIDVLETGPEKVPGIHLPLPVEPPK